MSTEQNQTSLTPFYKGWDEYQQHIVKAISPLTAEQLMLRAGPSLRTIGMIATHMVAVRVRWFQDLMGEAKGNTELEAIGRWDRPGQPVRSAAELTSGFEMTWQLIADALTRWTPADLAYIFQKTYEGEEYALSRQWVIWHVIEHDLHHGGELSFSLGMHDLPAIDI